MLRKFLLALALCLLPLTANAATCNWTGGGANWDNSNTASWSCGHVPVAGDTVVFDGSSGGGTVVVCGTSSANCPNGAGVVTITSLTTSAFTGTLDFATRNPDITLTSTAAFVDAGTGTHTINMGDGTWTLSGNNGILWNVSGAGLTLVANSSTIAFTGTTTSNSRTFNTGGKTYNTVTFSNNGYGVFMGSGGGTITTLTINVPNQVGFQGSLTITNALNVTGTSANLVYMNCSNGVTVTLTATANMQWVVLGHMVVGTSALNATNSFDLGGNTLNGGSITGPSFGSGGGGFIIGGG